MAIDSEKKYINLRKAKMADSSLKPLTPTSKELKSLKPSRPVSDDEFRRLKPLKPSSQELKSLKPMKRVSQDELRGLKPLKPASQELKPLKPSSQVLRPMGRASQRIPDARTEQLLLKKYVPEITGKESNAKLASMKSIAVTNSVSIDPKQLKPTRYVATSISPDIEPQKYHIHSYGPYPPPIDYDHGEVAGTISTTEGLHDNSFGGTRVRYYVPRSLNRNTEFMFVIHGNGGDHVIRYHYLSEQFFEPNFWPLFAEMHNCIVIAPLFDRLYHLPNWDLVPASGMIQSRGPDGEIAVFDLRDLNQQFYNERLYEFIIEDMRIPVGSNDPAINWYNWPDVSYFLNFQNMRNSQWFYYGTEGGRIERVWRADHKLLWIFETFQKAFAFTNNHDFNIFGFSAGAQFVTRFMLFYGHLLNKVAIAAPGSLTFPCFGESGFGCFNEYDQEHHDPPTSYPEPADFHFGHSLYFDETDKADYPDLNTSPNILNRALSELVKKRIFLIVGSLDLVDDYFDVWWQGPSRLSRLINYRNSMLHAAYKLHDQGILRPFEFNWTIRILDGVRHSWREAFDYCITHWDEPFIANHDFTGPAWCSLCNGQ